VVAAPRAVGVEVLLLDKEAKSQGRLKFRILIETNLTY
jgi:hypothetical protein